MIEMAKKERILTCEVKVHCCRVDTGEIAYTSEPNRMTYGETADEFSESLVLWRDKILEFIEADLEETVDVELCQKIGGKSLIYCGQYTQITNIKVEETEEVKISELEKQSALDRIKRLEALYGTDLEPRAREEVERIKRIYKLEYVY